MHGEEATLFRIFQDNMGPKEKQGCGELYDSKGTKNKEELAHDNKKLMAEVRALLKNVENFITSWEEPVREFNVVEETPEQEGIAIPQQPSELDLSSYGFGFGLLEDNEKFIEFREKIDEMQIKSLRRKNQQLTALKQAMDNIEKCLNPSPPSRPSSAPT